MNTGIMETHSQGVKNRLRILKERAAAAVVTMAPGLCSLSDRIFHNPELGFSEYKASGWLSQFLADHGFEVEMGVAGMNTAFRAYLPGTPRPGPARRGATPAQCGEVPGSSPGQSADPVVALLAEYDALPEIGHGCGHNIIGVAACGAAAAVRGVLGEIRGTVVVYGCPAEEGAVLGAGGKVALVRQGYFDGVDAAMMIHPASRYVVSSKSLARAALKIVFRGGEAGEGVQSAALLAFNAINALRQHLTPGARVHGVIASGDLLPARTEVAAGRCEIRAYVRAPNTPEMEACVAKVKDCACGAALAAGCEIEFGYTSPTYEEMVTNEELAAAFAANLKALGVDVEEGLDAGTGSTDMGNVSHVTPSLHAYVATCPRGVPGHTREFGRATLTQDAHENMLTGVKALAMTVVDLLGDPAFLAKVKAEFERTVRNE